MRSDTQLLVTTFGVSPFVSAGVSVPLRRYPPARRSPSAIRRIDEPDSIVDGFKRGALVGGLAGAALGFLVSQLCEGVRDAESLFRHSSAESVRVLARQPEP